MQDKPAFHGVHRAFDAFHTMRNAVIERHQTVETRFDRSEKVPGGPRRRDIVSEQIAVIQY